MDNHPVPLAKRQLAAQTLFVSQLMDTHTEASFALCSAKAKLIS